MQQTRIKHNKVTLRSKSNISYIDDKKMSSCGQQKVKSLKFSQKIWQEYGASLAESEIQAFKKRITIYW